MISYLFQHFFWQFFCHLYFQCDIFLGIYLICCRSCNNCRSSSRGIYGFNLIREFSFSCNVSHICDWTLSSLLPFSLKKITWLLRRERKENFKMYICVWIAAQLNICKYIFSLLETQVPKKKMMIFIFQNLFISFDFLTIKKLFYVRCYIWNHLVSLFFLIECTRTIVVMERRMGGDVKRSLQTMFGF